MKRNKADLVPCFCQLCNGKLVTRYFRRKHAQAYCDTKRSKISNIEEPVSQQVDAEGMKLLLRSWLREPLRDG